MSKNNIIAHNAVVQLDTPVHKRNSEELVQVNRQQMDRIKLAPDYATTPLVQSAVTALSGSTDAVDKKLSAIEVKRAELATLIQERDVGLADMNRDREALRVAINVVAKGSADAIKAWNCFVLTKQRGSSSNEAPLSLHLKNSPTTPGLVTAKCKGVKGAGAYLFAFTIDPNAAPGSGQIVTSTGSRCDAAGQQVGHVVYVRVAVVRQGGEQSVWSEPAQLLVR